METRTPPNGFVNSSVQASVRVHAGETIQIFKAGARIYELSVAPLAPSTKKGN